MTVLLVEDHPMTMAVMQRLLSSMGHIVIPATCVRAAVEIASAEPFDLLISDVGLPDGTGHDVMRQIRAMKNSDNIRGIAVSGYGTESDIRRSLEAGFGEHLVKPLDLKVLTAAINNASGM